MHHTKPKDINSLNLVDIEKRLLDIEEDKPRRLHSAEENYSGSQRDDREADDIAYLDVEKAKLQLMRQFLLDKRDNWIARLIFNILVPIVVASITAYLISAID